MALRSGEFELIENALRAHLGNACQLTGARALSGGDISRCFLLETGAGRFFAKLHSADRLRFFQAERDALLAIWPRQMQTRAF